MLQSNPRRWQAGLHVTFRNCKIGTDHFKEPCDFTAGWKVAKKMPVPVPTQQQDGGQNPLIDLSAQQLLVSVAIGKRLHQPDMKKVQNFCPPPPPLFLVPLVFGFPPLLGFLRIFTCLPFLPFTPLTFLDFRLNFERIFRVQSLVFAIFERIFAF